MMHASGFTMDQIPNSAGRFVDELAGQDERTFSLWTHLAGLLSVATAGVPVLGLIVTLILWRSRGATSPFVDDHGREAMNFQLSIGFYWLGGLILGAMLVPLTLGLAVPLVTVGAALGPILLTILTGVGCVRGALAANKGEYYRYPMCCRWLKAPAERL